MKETFPEAYDRFGGYRHSLSMRIRFSSVQPYAFLYTRSSWHQRLICTFGSVHGWRTLVKIMRSFIWETYYYWQQRFILSDLVFFLRSSFLLNRWKDCDESPCHAYMGLSFAYVSSYSNEILVKSDTSLWFIRKIRLTSFIKMCSSRCRFSGNEDLFVRPNRASGNTVQV